MCSTIPPLRAFNPPFASKTAMSRSNSVSESEVMAQSRKNISGMVRRTRSKNTAPRPQSSRTREKRLRKSPVLSGDGYYNEEVPTSNVKAPAEVPANDYNARRLEASMEPPEVQQNVEILHEPALHQYNTLDDGTSDLSPGDPITSRRTLDFVEDLLTPLQSSPIEGVYETTANAWDYGAVQQQPDESSLAISPGLQDVFDEWLDPIAFSGDKGHDKDLKAMSGHSGEN